MTNIKPWVAANQKWLYYIRETNHIFGNHTKYAVNPTILSHRLLQSPWGFGILKTHCRQE